MTSAIHRTVRCVARLTPVLGAVNGVGLRRDVPPVTRGPVPVVVVAKYAATISTRPVNTVVSPVGGWGVRKLTYILSCRP